MRAFQTIVAGVLVLVVGWKAVAQNAAVEPAQRQPRLDHAANVFNELVLNRGPTAIACKIGSTDSYGVTTSYYLGPLKRTNEGTYECRIKWSVVTYRPQQQPDVSKGESTLILAMEGTRVVRRFRYGDSLSSSDDVKELGNGLLFETRGVGAGDIVSVEYVRNREGKAQAIQRYQGLTATVVYNEVPVPPELQGGAEQAKVEDVTIYALAGG